MVVVAENRLAYVPTSQPLTMSSNQITDNFSQRTEERAKMVRKAIVCVGKQLLVTVPPSKRTAAESQLLYDCSRGRRPASDETLAGLMAIQDRIGGHALSDELRGLESAVTVPVCALEANEQEHEPDAALDMAQLKAAREQTPARWRAVWELCQRQIDALRKLADAAAQQMHRRPT